VCSPDINNCPQSSTPPDGHESPRQSPVDAELARRAARQHGVLSRAQCYAAGLSANAVQYRLKIGRLQPIHPGVYGVGHAPVSPIARAMAAVLACGPGAVLSHRSAAALWGVDPRWRTPMDVTACTYHDVRGIRLHRTRTLTATQVTKHEGIPVTNPARTVLDLAEVVDDAALARALNEAQIICRLRVDDLARLLADASGRRGAARLKALIAPAGAPTRSAFEDAFLAFAERHGLPQPEVNRRVAGHEVDMLWRAERLAVELDGFAFHRHRRPFEHDRDKDADLLAAGYPVVRITWRRLTEQPDREASRLRAMLDRRRAGSQLAG
jgi:very-short-patch-repair endonuclease